MDMFDNSILKPHLDQFSEYMMENGEYHQGILVSSRENQSGN